jgi:hypothetical protein
MRCIRIHFLALLHTFYFEAATKIRLVNGDSYAVRGIIIINQISLQKVFRLDVSKAMKYFFLMCCDLGINNLQVARLI